MQLRSKRQARWLIATFAAVTMAASLTWWVTTTFNTPDLDLFAILVLAATGAATVAFGTAQLNALMFARVESARRIC